MRSPSSPKPPVAATHAPAPAAVGQLPSSLDAWPQAWQHVQQAWADDGAHEQFLALAQQCHRLHDAARLYRAELEVPARADGARARLATIEQAALVQLEASRSVARPTPRWLHVLAALLCTLLLASLAAAWFGWI